MSEHPKTVRVVSPITDENPNGYIVINEDDLHDGHELYEEPKEDAAPAAKRKKD